MILLGHALAAALYLFAAVAGWRPTHAPARVVPWVMGLGATLHGLGFYGMHLQEPPVPLESVPAALSLMGWLIALAYLGASAFARIGAGAPWVALLAALLTLCAEAGLRFSVGLHEPASGSRLWSHAHVLLSVAGFSLLALASLAGVGYLAKERALKRKGASGRPRDLPPLESLDRTEHLTLMLGFALLTLGVVAGFAWSLGRGASPWTGHSAFSLVAWAVYLFPVSLRLVSGQHGPRPARGVVLGFAVLAFSYIGIRFLGAVA